MGIMRAVIGGNNQCHCIHVTELDAWVTVLEQGRQAGDPWHQHIPRSVPPGAGSHQPPGVSLLARDDLFPCSSLDHWGRSDSRSVAYLMTR